MNDKEFLDALQAEVKRLTDLNREYVRQIQTLQAENEKLTKQGGLGARMPVKESRDRFLDNPVPKSKWRNNA